MRRAALAALCAVALVAAAFFVGGGSGQSQTATPTLTLVSPFDIDQDEQVNIGDVLLMRPHYGARTGDALYQRRLDLNADGTIDALDIAMFREMMQRECPCGDWVDVWVVGVERLAGFDIEVCGDVSAPEVDLLLAELDGSDVIEFSRGRHIAAVDFGPPDGSVDESGAGVLARYRGPWQIGEWTLVYTTGHTDGGAAC